MLALGISGTVAPAPWNAVCWLLVGLVLVQVLIALLAVHVAYDRSRLYQAFWIGEDPCELLLVTAGFDRTTKHLLAAGHSVNVRDLHSELPSLTRSLRRAVRSHADRPAASGMGDPGGADLVLFMLSAHELRDSAMRVDEFERARECVGPNGRVLVVEYIRGLGVWLAFGPAAGHFFALRTWETTAAQASLRIHAIEQVAPFVSCLELRPGAPAVA